jgi:hypothetical protein
MGEDKPTTESVEPDFGFDLVDTGALAKKVLPPENPPAAAKSVPDAAETRREMQNHMASQTLQATLFSRGPC